MRSQYQCSEQSVILNFLPIAAGGGLQNSLSFLTTLAESGVSTDGFVAVVRKDSELDRKCTQCGLQTIRVGNDPWSRARFEVNCRNHFHRGQVCFTIFGIPMLTSADYLTNVVGCAYSNLLYPEIWFWSYCSPKDRIRLELVDAIRRRCTATADYWVFETDILAKRAVDLCHFPRERVGVVRMAASCLVTPAKVLSDAVHDFDQVMPPGHRFLSLCSHNPNKRLHCLPQIARELAHTGLRKFTFVLTLDERTPYAQAVLRGFQSLGVSDHVCNIGRVPAESVPSLIASCDAMCTFSVLESFSNNFVEAWRMSKPLVVTDADWSRGACGDAALYVDPTDSRGCAEALRDLMANPATSERLVNAGSRQLATYPDCGAKNQAYLEHISKAVSLGPCSRRERRMIRWPAICRKALI